jgi:zinc-binding in reverse transcriptase
MIILSTTHLNEDQRDIPIWNLTSDHLYTYKSFYFFVKDTPAPTANIQYIWSIPKVVAFSWLMLRNNILTIDNLQKRGWQLVKMYILCKREQETVHYLFNDYFFVKTFGSKLKESLKPPIIGTGLHI